MTVLEGGAVVGLCWGGANGSEVSAVIPPPPPSLFGLLLTIGTNENAAYAWLRDLWPATGGAGVLTKPQNVEAVVDRHDYDILVRGEGEPRLACCRRQCL